MAATSVGKEAEITTSGFGGAAGMATCKQWSKECLLRKRLSSLTGDYEACTADGVYQRACYHPVFFNQQISFSNRMFTEAETKKS